MGFTVEGIDHVEVFVRDIERSVAWYGDVLGLKETRRWDPQPVMIGAGGNQLALFRAPAESTDATGPRKQAHWHLVAWRTTPEGFLAAQEHLRGMGVPFQGPVDHRGARSIYFGDPDGNPLEITSYP